MPKGNNRNTALDFIRVMACMMVVGMHSPLPADREHSLFLSTVSFLCAPAVGLFFMLSGYLLLPTKLSAVDFFKQRFSKLAIPTIIWSLIYMWLRNTYKGGNNEVLNLLSIPFSAQGDGVMWFMYTLLGFYLIIPIVSPWLKVVSLKEATMYLYIFILVFSYSILSPLLHIDVSERSISHFFYGYTGYSFIGWYVKRFMHSVRFRLLGLLTAIVFVVAASLKFTDTHINFYSCFWYLSLPILVYTSFLFIATLKAQPFLDGLPLWTKNIIGEVSRLSFGIYLVHIAVMRYTLWNCAFIRDIHNIAAQTFIIFCLTFIFSYLVVRFVSSLPSCRYIFGVASAPMFKIPGKSDK